MKKEVHAVKVNGLPKQLYRSESNFMIAGVATGVAKYFLIDPTIVRLAFIFSSIFFGGIGLLIYILMWVVVPPESAIIK